MTDDTRQTGSGSVAELLDDSHERDRGLVLLAEDNESNQLVEVLLLEQRGFRVDVAGNGRVALELCRQRRYEAVFMDSHMPELDGYETAAELRRREGPNRHTPIIAITASSMSGDRERCLAAGMDDYVAKPISVSALDDAITRTLGRHESGRTSLLDRSMLDGLCQGDEQVRSELVGLFAEQSLANVADIESAIQSGNSEALHRDAHQLKGSAASVGALRMAELCDSLCQAGRAGALADAAPLLEELKCASKLTRAAW